VRRMAAYLLVRRMAAHLLVRFAPVSGASLEQTWAAGLLLRGRPVSARAPVS